MVAYIPESVTIIPFPNPIKKINEANNKNTWLCEAAISETETIKAAKTIIVLMPILLIMCVMANALVDMPVKKMSGNIPALPALRLKLVINMRMVDGNNNCINPEITIIG